MSDKKAESKPEPTPAASTGGKRLPIKTIVVVLGLMAAEAVAVFLILGMTGPAKSLAQTEQASLHRDDSEETMEVQVADEKYQNLQTGRVWIWDTAVFVQVKNKNVGRVETTLERRKAEINEGISRIISRAQLAQLKEPERQTLNRQFAAFLNDVFGTDAEGKSLIERVMIPKCRGFPADF